MQNTVVLMTQWVLCNIGTKERIKMYLKTSRVYCSKRQDQTSSFQSLHSHKGVLHNHMVVPAQVYYLFIVSSYECYCFAEIIRIQYCVHETK